MPPVGTSQLSSNCCHTFASGELLSEFDIFSWLGKYEKFKGRNLIRPVKFLRKMPRKIKRGLVFPWARCLKDYKWNKSIFEKNNEISCVRVWVELFINLCRYTKADLNTVFIYETWWNVCGALRRVLSRTKHFCQKKEKSCLWCIISHKLFIKAVASKGAEQAPPPHKFWASSPLSPSDPFRPASTYPSLGP